MPELPEVETIRRSLLPELIGRVIEDLYLYISDILINADD
jgi:formamidopyrimidine-DNA glycosylase